MPPRGPMEMSRDIGSGPSSRGATGIYWEVSRYVPNILGVTGPQTPTERYPTQNVLLEKCQ